MEQQNHYCAQCNKSFSCGKALGGHMSSAHVQPAKDYSTKLKIKNSKNNNIAADDSGSRKKIFSCQVCPKEFGAVKSLYGHMRCHPEREWRGVEAPKGIIMNKPHHDNSGSDSDDDDDDDDYDSSQEGNVDDIDDDLSLINLRDQGVISECSWGSRGKRGRVGSITHEPSSSMVEDDHEVMNAACLLMCLSKSWIPNGKHPMLEYADMCNSTTSFASNLNRSRRDQEDCKDDSFKEAADALLELHSKSLKYPCDEEDDETKTKTKTKTLEKSHVVFEANDPKEVIMIGENKKKGKKKMVVVVKEEKLDLVGSPTKKYKCPQCPNEYTCYQALGGHMSTHTKFENHSLNHSTAASCSQILSRGETSSEQKLHQCKTCKQIFLSGQALGGHQRCHWNNNGHNSSSSPTKKGLNIDLNESPHDIVEDKNFTSSL